MAVQKIICSYSRLIRMFCVLYVFAFLLLPLQGHAMSFDTLKQVFNNDPLMNNNISTSVTTAEDGTQIRFTAGGGVLHVMHGKREVLRVDGEQYWGYKVDEITASNPSKKFWIIRCVAGARVIDYEFWVVGLKSNGEFVQYLTPDAVRNSGYEPLKQHRLVVELKGDRLSLAAKDEYMPEGVYYGYQRAYRLVYHVELFWDDNAEWFGIDRLL